MVTNLGLRSLEQRRADARLCLFYKFVYGLHVVAVPNYVHLNLRISIPHSLIFRQSRNSRDYYKYMYSFFPLAILSPVECSTEVFIYFNLSSFIFFTFALSNLIPMLLHFRFPLALPERPRGRMAVYRDRN